ncbi:MAG: hypothetical protein KKD39_07100 [Candidatus Altiarchaeota archaeon]|nr:hypothetical protein [Candidatus Altiarchaeota archaeon]
MKKGQIFTWDLIFGSMLFLVALAIALNIWESTYLQIRTTEDDYERNWLAETISEQLVRTTGEPGNWTPADVVSYGLTKTDATFKKTTSRVLDPDKLLMLIDAFYDNYTKVRGDLLGSSKYNVYIELSCINQSNLACIQGLTLNSVENSVSCNNQIIHVRNKKTDNYYFLEAEELWGDYSDTTCDKGCSKGNMSVVHGKSTKTIVVDPGRYRIWIRPLEDMHDVRFTVNEYNYPLYVTNVPGQVNWNLMGDQNLEFEATLGFENTKEDTKVDAILLTTDMTYDPRYTNQGDYGKPDIEDTCIIGQVGEGANIVSSSKTAVMSVPETHQETFSNAYYINTKVVKVNVILYEGIALPPKESTSSTTTTTTLPEWIEIPCTGPVSEGCTANQMNWIDIQDVRLYNSGGAIDNTIYCDVMKNLDVRWMGAHAGDNNYFGFFIENESSFIGSCESEAPENEDAMNYYQMNCSVTAEASSIGVADGVYTLVVTAEDMVGYCNATDSRVDEKYEKSILLRDCVAYTDISCGYSSETWPGSTCDQTDDRVDSIIAAEVPDTLTCNSAPYSVNIKFKGRRNMNGNIRWAFLVQNGGSYVCVGKCRFYQNPSSHPVEDELQYYSMSCSLDMNNVACPGGNYLLDNGIYSMYITAETDTFGYCTNPSQADAYLLKQVTLSNCGPPP